MRSFATILLSLSLPLHAFAAHAINHAHRHDVALRPRGPNARLSFYDITTGTTACGGNYPASAHVVAMNSVQFGDVPGHSEWCGKTITISYGGKSTTATVVDKCPGCGNNGLDLTEGLFAFFSDLGAGIIYGSWEGGDGGAAPAVAAPTSSKAPPSPTSHYTPPTTTSHTTSSPPPSSTSTSTTSKTSSSLSSAAPTTSSQPSSSTHSSTQTSSSGVAVPSGTPSNEQDQATDVLLQAVLGLGNIVAASKS